MLVTYKNKSHLIDISVWTDGRRDEEIIFINKFIGVEIEGSGFIVICVDDAVG